MRIEDELRRMRNHTYDNKIRIAELKESNRYTHNRSCNNKEVLRELWRSFLTYEVFGATHPIYEYIRKAINKLGGEKTVRDEGGVIGHHAVPLTQNDTNNARDKTDSKPPSKELVKSVQEVWERDYKDDNLDMPEGFWEKSHKETLKMPDIKEVAEPTADVLYHDSGFTLKRPYNVWVGADDVIVEKKDLEFIFEFIVMDQGEQLKNWDRLDKIEMKYLPEEAK